jgi:hypothetical protein
MKKVGLLFLALVLFFPCLPAGRAFLASAAVMNSQNFRIGSDVIGVGGGIGNSANFKADGTAGEMVVGISDSATYGTDAGFWQSESQGLSLSCEASSVYMVDYTLGDSDNYNKYLFSSSQDCTVTDNTTAPWTLTASSTALTSAQNNVPNTSVFISTDNDVGNGDTITTPTTNLTEPSTGDYSLETPRTIINGTASASGVYVTQPTLKITDLNSLYNESLSGTLTITIQ